MKHISRGTNMLMGIIKRSKPADWMKRGAIEPHDGVISRQDGFFRLPLPAGTHRLLVHYPDYLHYASHPLEVYAHQETQYDFRFPAPARISGWISEEVVLIQRAGSGHFGHEAPKAYRSGERKDFGGIQGAHKEHCQIEGNFGSR